MFKAKNYKKFCIGLFIDLRKAFDVCSHDILLRKLSKYGIKRHTLTWFKNYLKERIKIVDINSYLSLEKSFNIRVIQAGILGPILFLIYINDLCSVSLH